MPPIRPEQVKRSSFPSPFEKAIKGSYKSSFGHPDYSKRSFERNFSFARLQQAWGNQPPTTEFDKWVNVQPSDRRAVAVRTQKRDKNRFAIEDPTGVWGIHPLEKGRIVVNPKYRISTGPLQQVKTSVHRQDPDNPFTTIARDENSNGG